MVEKRPVDPITSFPTGRTLFYFCTRHFVPGYLRIVPSGQRLSTPCPRIRRQIMTDRAPLEDDDEDEND